MKTILQALVVSAAATLIPSIYAAAPDQADFPACPSHWMTKYCCDLGVYQEGDTNEEYGTIKYVFKEYRRPRGKGNSGGDFTETYEEGWLKQRQINYPYSQYTVDTQKFHWRADDYCTLSKVGTKMEGNDFVYEYNCTTDPAEAKALGFVEDKYVTFEENPRNNMARCAGTYIKINTTDDELACSFVSVPIDYYFTTGGEPPAVVIYVIYGALFACIGLWYAYKRMYEATVLHQVKDKSATADKDANLMEDRGGPVTPVPGESTAGRKSHVSMRSTEIKLREQTKEVKQVGYKDSFVGSALLAWFGFMALCVHVLLIMVIMDYYGHFPRPLLKSGQPLLSVYIVFWCIMLIWSMVIVLTQKTIRNFFRLRAPLEQSDFVYLFKPEYSEIMLKDRTKIVDFVQKVEKTLMPDYQPGHDATVPVQITENGSRYIEFQNIRYSFLEEWDQFIPSTIELGETFKDILLESEGLSEQAYNARLNHIGPNAIDIEMPTLLMSIRMEFFTFFYIYQMVCYYVWYYFDYWKLAIVMTCVIALSAIINIYTTRKMRASIVKMSKYETQVLVKRSDQWKTVSSRDLVPGDLVSVEENWTLPCDMIIVAGATVCDESMLTGEANPVQKFPIPESDHEYDAAGGGKKYTLFSGTKVLSSGRDEEIYAVVQTTGAHTSKGLLIQNILFPVLMRFKYDEHLKVIIGLLLVYAVIAVILAVKFLTSNASLSNPLNTFCYAIFLLSGIVSPLLPCVITIGQVNAAKRLEKLSVFSLNTNRITLTGKIRVFCFDKTGTLTKEGLDFLGFKPIDTSNQTFLDMVPSIDLNNMGKLSTFALASCHSVGSLNGDLVGNQVEVKMFRATGWELMEEQGKQPIVKSPSGTQLQVVKRFEFDHHRMSMSVVMRDVESGKLYVFCKGSYEKMQQVATDDSLPGDYMNVSEELARDGCYVLGMTVRELPAMEESELQSFIKDRDAVETGLHSLGLVLFRNELKEDTTDAIRQLQEGQIRPAMITGDNAMCGCYIAKQCGMVKGNSQVLLADMQGERGTGKQLVWSDVKTRETYSTEQVRGMAGGDGIELAVTGPAFDHLCKIDLMNELLLHTRIYSRMTPDGKVQCVQMHMDKGLVTGMCGDGGNDCGALRIAHAGIALSDAEASIVSPFTSKTKTVMSVVDLCREGRCSLATSFGSVKFLIMYGLICSTLRLVQYYYAIMISEWCFVVSDAFCLVGFSYFITLSKPKPYLGSERPTSSLVGPTTIGSILGQEAINVIFLLTGLHYLSQADWYCPFDPAGADLSKWWLLADNASTTCLFFSGVVQQQASAFVYSFGSSFRQPIWRNWQLCLFFAALVAFTLYLLLGEPSVVMDQLRIASSTNVVGLPDIPMPLSFRTKYMGFLLGNMVATMLFEYIFILGPVRNFLRSKFHKDLFDLKM